MIEPVTEFRHLKAGDWVSLKHKAYGDFVIAGTVTDKELTIDYDTAIMINDIRFFLTEEAGYYISEHSRPVPRPEEKRALRFRRKNVEAWSYGLFRDGIFIGTEVPTSVEVVMELADDVVWNYLG